MTEAELINNCKKQHAASQKLLYDLYAAKMLTFPVVDLFLQPGSILLLTLNVALPATDARAVTSFVWRKVSVPPARDIEAVVDPAAKVTVV